MSSQDTFAEIHALISHGKHAEALALLFDANTNEIRKPFRQDLNHAWYVVGDICYRTEDFGSAIEAFEQALSDRPDDDEAILALANACSEAGDYARAENALRRGLALKPENDTFLYNLGNVFFDRGEYQHAIDIYQQVSAADKSIFENASRNRRSAQEKLSASGA